MDRDMFKIYFKIHRSMLHKGQYRLNFEDFEVDQARREGGGANCPGPPATGAPKLRKGKINKRKKKIKEPTLRPTQTGRDSITRRHRAPRKKDIIGHPEKSLPGPHDFSWRPWSWSLLKLKIFRPAQSHTWNWWIASCNLIHNYQNRGN
jgi:hypothetical protein